MEIKFKAVEELRQVKTIPISEEDRIPLKENIKRYGIKSPLIVQGNRILDGNTRYEIAKELGIPFLPVVEVDDEDDPEIIGLILNVIRRQLPWEQRLEYLKRIYELEGKVPLKTRTEILEVSEGTAKKIATIEKRDPELFEKIKNKEVSVDKAYMQIKISKTAVTSIEREDTRGELIERQAGVIELTKPAETAETITTTITPEGGKKQIQKVINEIRQILLDPARGVITEERHTEAVIRVLKTMVYFTEYLTDNIRCFSETDREKIEKELTQVVKAIVEYKKTQVVGANQEQILIR